MKQTRFLMGMPITIEVIDPYVTKDHLDGIFSYFIYIDQTFSTYKQDSEMMRINRGLIKKNEYSKDMQTILDLSEQTKQETNGYFDIKRPDTSYEPAGIVKGWAIQQAGLLLKEEGFSNFYIDAGGDIQVSGNNTKGKDWKIGIRNPFHRDQIIKQLTIHNKGVATSGTYIRGNHIYNPHTQKKPEDDIVSLTVIGSNIYEADRFATAAFAMGSKGINFIESLDGFEGYMINSQGIATFTTKFSLYTQL